MSDNFQPTATPNYTPWGFIQTCCKIADGIWKFDTAEHGGLWIDKARWELLKVKFPDFVPFAGVQWFEEDSDWAYVAAMWPELFSAEQRSFAAQEIARQTESKN